MLASRWVVKLIDTKQSVIDISKEFGIVSPYTSMISLREERFAELGIARTNKDRVAVEHKAQKKRAAQPVKTTRVDKPKPMFSKPQPNYSSGSRGGSGNFGLLGVLFAVIGMKVFPALGLRNTLGPIIGLPVGAVAGFGILALYAKSKGE